MLEYGPPHTNLSEGISAAMQAQGLEALINNKDPRATPICTTYRGSTTRRRYTQPWCFLSRSLSRALA